ncbi:MAG: DUF2779 domain-containing protein, partial [Candidatus Thioglobus sp.]|nr:DUF2779 domain-containing protein [Candidatus Thioglobus sp.]
MKYLTKSKFKLATECPTKLFYTGKNEYANTSLDNPFLEALAEGGFQVGELAKQYLPGGYNIHTLDYDKALEQTNKLLKQDEVVIYEAAIKYDNLFIRVDILIKCGNYIKLYEVKAKSIDLTKRSLVSQDGNKILSTWKPYLFDIAFQRYVARSAFPDSIVTTYLYLVDKNKVAPTDGLNQKFQIAEDKNRRKGVKVSSSLTKEDLSIEMLCKVPVDEYCDLIFDTDAGNDEYGISFKDRINEYAKAYNEDFKIKPRLSSVCGKCEFKASQEDLDDGKLSGYRECWKQQLSWPDEYFEMSNVLDIWNFRNKDKFIQEGKIKFSDIYEEDILTKKVTENKERQWLQIEKVKNNDDSIWLDSDGLKTEMDSWVFPLHFIDFETTAMAIPFNKGRHPYEGVAFQFSHHVVHKDGSIEHKGEYINTERGIFPNYEFVRQLEAQLGNDQGTIFKYSNHENTYLNMIYEQLQSEQKDVADKDELCDFIKSITKSKKASIEKWCGERNMVDMLEVVKDYYYNPMTRGSNSIKQVLPATLNSSDYLKEKYSKPIYGTDVIPSKNFKDWIWFKFEDDIVKDPYKLLPVMFQEADKFDNLLSDNDELKDGGAAMTAYARMQFEQ